ncbi:MAG TPA: hypothetical protein VFU22_09650, partial [Roseiflexaceae bacterium]|nr:hypothetical protein [Roseiflexaceae bacterium]
MYWKRFTFIGLIMALALTALLVPSRSAAQTTAATSVAATNPFYTFDLVAVKDQAGLTSMAENVSINDLGNVAFVGRLATGGEGIFVGDSSASLSNISPAFSTSPSRVFGSGVQINNANQVVAHDRISGSPPRSFVRVWDANRTDAHTTIAQGGGTLDRYTSVFLSRPSINNAGQVVFSASK